MKIKDRISSNCYVETTRVRFLCIISFFCISVQGYAQYYTVYTQSYSGVKSRIYIDDVLQVDISGFNFQIQGIPLGRHTMRLELETKPPQSLSITIGESQTKAEYYAVIPDKGKNILKISEPFRYSSSYGPVWRTYKSKPRPIVRDTSLKSDYYSCEVSDSFVNDIIRTVAKLKDKTIQHEYIDQYLYRKCLKVYQIRALSSRIDNEQDLLTEYQKYYTTCNDKRNYPELIKSFTTEGYAQTFKKWLNQQR